MAEKKAKLEGVKSAGDTMKQLITMSTGLLGFTVTFAGQFKAKDAVLSVPPSLAWSWALFVMAIACGFWTLLAVTGSINQADGNDETADAMGSNIRIPAIISVASFILAIMLMVYAGIVIAR